MLPRCSCRNRVHPPSRSWNRFSDRPKYLVVATPLAEAPKAGGAAPPGAAPPPLEARPSASPGSVPFDGRTQVCELLDAHNKAISAPLRSLQSDVSHHRHAIESHSKPEWARSLERQIQAQFQKLERDMHAAVPAPPRFRALALHSATDPVECPCAVGIHMLPVYRFFSLAFPAASCPLKAIRNFCWFLSSSGSSELSNSIYFRISR